jgi:hypothetical protein
MDGLGQFAVVEGEGRIVLAVGGIAGHRDIVEREIVDLLQRTFASRFQADELHARDMLARSGVLEQGNETWRHSCDVDHQRVELRLAGTAAGATIGQLGQFVEGELIDVEIAFKTLDGGIAGYPIDPSPSCIPIT